MVNMKKLYIQIFTKFKGYVWDSILKYKPYRSRDGPQREDNCLAEQL